MLEEIKVRGIKLRERLIKKYRLGSINQVKEIRGESDDWCILLDSEYDNYGFDSWSYVVSIT